jgi:hypothetical protein
MRTSKRLPIVAIALAIMAVGASCTASVEETGASSTFATTPTEISGCADVIEATLEPSGDGYRVSATILSRDTGWEKYADAWEVRTPDGTVLGTRILAHPHVDEQPFTRSLDGVVIPTGATDVEIAARDLVAGFCGETFTAAVPGR